VKRGGRDGRGSGRFGTILLIFARELLHQTIEQGDAAIMRGRKG